MWLWPLAQRMSDHEFFMVKSCKSFISGVGGPIDIEQKGWESVIHDRDHDLLVSKVSYKDLPDSDQDGLRCRRSADSSRCSYDHGSTKIRPS